MNINGAANSTTGVRRAVIMPITDQRLRFHLKNRHPVRELCASIFALLKLDSKLGGRIQEISQRVECGETTQSKPLDTSYSSPRESWAVFRAWDL